MAHRSASAPLDADNKLGSSPAVRSDWHCGVADFHLGTGHSVPTQDAGYTTASELLSAKHRSVSTCGGVHSALRMRPQRLREQCFIEDEGRPLGVGLQELASNHLKLRGLRVRVVSVEEKAERTPSDECW